MNIDIASRLYELRKKTNLSQEELAEKIGVSRQAVSKWERAESSPDTDNLIELARLYGVSLDMLLSTTEPIDKSAEQPRQDYISIGPDGIRVKDKDGSEVLVSLNSSGVEINERDQKKVKVKKEKVDKEKVDYIKKVGDALKEKKEPIRLGFLALFPAPFIITALYLAIGFLFNTWHPTWIMFLLIPIYYQLFAMAKLKTMRRKLNCFPIALLCVVVYLLIGFLLSIWSPTWLIFFLIPTYYFAVNVAKFNNNSDSE